jgi:hypothetical protein
MSTGDLNEEQLRALYEEQMRQIRVDDVLMNSVVELINQGMRRTGLVAGESPDAIGGQADRDPEQVRLAIEAVRALLPVVETIAGDQMAPLRQALSQLQLAYVRIGGAPPAESAAAAGGSGAAPGPAGGPAATGPAPASPEPPADPAKPGEPGPAQRSGRLWVPGQ